jgi:hypothetical protein
MQIWSLLWRILFHKSKITFVYFHVLYLFGFFPLPSFQYISVHVCVGMWSTNSFCYNKNMQINTNTYTYEELCRNPRQGSPAACSECKRAKLHTQQVLESAIRGAWPQSKQYWATKAGQRSRSAGDSSRKIMSRSGHTGTARHHPKPCERAP